MRRPKAEGQAMFSKCIVVVDEDVDVQNVSEVARGRLHAALAGRPRNVARSQAPRRRALEAGGAIEHGCGLTVADHPAQAAELEDSGLRYHQGLTALRRLQEGP
jgi:hypothetical protein